MRITESRLRRIIRSVILERFDDDKATKEEQKIAKRIDETGMDLMKLTVEDVKFLLDEIQYTSTPEVYIPRFLRGIFPPDKQGHMIIKVNRLEELGFGESHISKLIDVYHGRNDGLVGQVFRPSQYTVINK